MFIYLRISAHPDITSCGAKEMSWWPFGRTYNNDIYEFERYLDMGDIAAQSILRSIRLGNTNNVQTTHPMIFGDGTPSTFYSNSHWGKYVDHDDHGETRQLLTPTFMKYIQPDAKLILILRNPLTLTLSTYNYFNLRSFNQSMHHFHNCVVKSIELILECNHQYSTRYCAVFAPGFAMLPQEYNSCVYVIKSLQAGQYHHFLKEWLVHYSMDQIRVIIEENYHKNTKSEIVGIWDFLGLQSSGRFHEKLIGKSDAINVNRHAMEDMLPATRELLNTFFKSANTKLAHMLKDLHLDWD